MNRRSFIQRCTVVGVALGLASRAGVGKSQERGDRALTYLDSFATPTLTDTYVSPHKTAKLNYGKHTKMAYCPLNGDLYLCGGDGQGQHWGGNGSGALDTVGRYNVEAHVYSEDFLYRGYVGEVTR